ncbi:unnamed protein product [Phytomonas sp. EM1]|nr:unnamed protein product [Phytomonas sp. EM1]|eukprot:CCW65519.1 unnamed protein product [Phytomonas sp. isolate EM1]
MAETRVWVRLRFLRQKDMLKFLQWYASTATLTPMDMGVGAHPRVKEAAVAFVRQVGEYQSACGMSFSTNKGSINSELSKERNVLMKPSRQWESYLRPRKDHRRNLSYSHFPLYLWQSFLPLAKNAFYCCERGLLRIEPYYNIDKASKCAILHRGRPKEKCHDVRKARDVNTTRTRTWTAHSGKQPNEGNLRTAPDRWQSAHSVPPFRCHREYSPKEDPPYPDNMHYTNSNPQTSEEARHSFESLDLGRRTSNRYKFDTVSIHSHEKGSDEDGSESWLRDHNESNRWDKVCSSDMFLCISEFYLLFYDSFGGLKFHLKLDDISAIFTPLLHPWYPIKSVEGATMLAKNNRESSSTWKPFGYPFIRFKMNTGGDEMNEPTLSVNFTFLPFVPPPSTPNCRKEASRDDVWKRQLDFLGVLRSLNKRTRYVDVDYEHYAKARRKARLRRRQPQPPVDPSKDLTSDVPWGCLCDSPEPTYIVWLRDADLIHEVAEAHEGALEWSSHLRTMSDSTDTCEVAGGGLSEKSPVTALPPTLSLPISVKEERRIAYDIYTSVCLAAPPFLSIDEKESESRDSQSDESCVPNSSGRHSSISGYSNEVEYFHGDTTRVIRTSEILNLYFAEAIRDDLTRDGSRVISSSDVLNLSSVDGRHDDLTCNTSGVDKNSSSQSGGIDLRSLAEPLFEAEPDEYVPIKPQRRNSLLLRKFR